MNKFYVYVHYRLDTNKPFYVGKGFGNRADISEDQAFELETFLIEFIGRKHLGLGPLVNMTDGGDGVGGYIWSEEQVEAARQRGIARYEDPAQREAVSKRYKENPELREASRQRQLKHYEDPKAREDNRQRGIKQFEDPAQREALRQAQLNAPRYQFPGRLPMLACLFKQNIFNKGLCGNLTWEQSKEMYLIMEGN